MDGEIKMERVRDTNYQTDGVTSHVHIFCIRTHKHTHTHTHTYSDTNTLTHTHLLLIGAVSLWVGDGGDDDDGERSSVANGHHVGRAEGGVEDQHHHPV